MKKTMRIVLSCILLAVLIVSAVQLLGQLEDKAEGTSTYADALQIAHSAAPDQSTQPTLPQEEPPEQTQPPQKERKSFRWVAAPIGEDAEAEELAQISLDALREVAPQVAGWIRIPGTQVDYPLMAGDDNDFFLTHTWDGTENSVGSIFLEYRNAPDLTDFNTIIYGHNMMDGSMFAAIRSYSAQEYWKQHPYIYILTDEGVLRYEVFSAYLADKTSRTYQISFRQEQSRTEFLNDVTLRSAVDTGIVPEETDRIVTLSTCSGAGYSSRWVIHGRLKMVQEVE